MSQVDDVTILHLQGEVSHEEMEKLESRIHELMHSNQFKIVLNFQSVQHVNYKLVSRILERVQGLRSHKGDLKCASMNDYTQNIFRFAVGDQTVESYDSVYDAVMSFQGEQDRHRTWH